MSQDSSHVRTRAQESTAAIEQLYISMRHLFNRGFYKPMGISGAKLKEALLELRPEIYGSVAEDRTELQGLLYVLDRLPAGIEECRYIHLTSDEGYKALNVKPIIPAKRRRNCYRIDQQQMNVEITRGRSEIYDILTHLTFLFIESHKIIKHVILDESGRVTEGWKNLEEVILKKGKSSKTEKETAAIYLSRSLGRTIEEVNSVYEKFANNQNGDRFLSIIYHLGKGAIDETTKDKKRIITFSPLLRERIGHHIHGEKWALTIKKTLEANDLLNRPLHIISANMHSVMNTLFAKMALDSEVANLSSMQLYELLSKPKNQRLRDKVSEFALKKGMIYVADQSGTNIDVQIFDTNTTGVTVDSTAEKEANPRVNPVIIVMDYAFGEQAYETMDELLKPYEGETKQFLNVASISIMGKAGILGGRKGDIMIPSAHVFEGTADNYPFKNRLKESDFNKDEVNVYNGSMITVLGTSLQNRDLLRFFYKSTWNVIGLEMEGAHYQKAIQSAAKIRGSISDKVKVMYAYYASDNPLETGSTLASGGLGTSGVKPTYLITKKILKYILE